MKISKEMKEKIGKMNINNIKLNFDAKCDLCGYIFKAIHKYPTMKADCPNCQNEVYTDAFDNVL